MADGSAPPDPDSSQASGWGASDPEVERVVSGYTEMFERATADEIVAALAVVWESAERAVVWIRSVEFDLERVGTTIIERTSGPLLLGIATQADSIAYIGRRGFAYLPNAMAAARTAFETGLRIAWIDSGIDDRERSLRALRLHSDAVRWKRRVAADLDQIGANGQRWLDAAARQQALVDRILAEVGWEQKLGRTPPVLVQLREMNLERLYFGYRLASEYLHGGLTSALEAKAVSKEASPFGLYWPNDWHLAISLSAWACVLAARCANPDFDFRPVRELMTSAEIMSRAPGVGWRLVTS